MQIYFLSFWFYLFFCYRKKGNKKENLLYSHRHTLVVSSVCFVRSFRAFLPVFFKKQRSATNWNCRFTSRDYPRLPVKQPTNEPTSQAASIYSSSQQQRQPYIHPYKQSIRFKQKTPSSSLSCSSFAPSCCCIYEKCYRYNKNNDILV